MTAASGNRKTDALVVLAVLLLLMGRATMAQAENLIRNPGFETRGGATPEQWETWAPREEIAPEFAVDSEGGRSGSAAARIRCRGAEQIGGWRQRCVGVEGGQTYRFTGHFRTEKIASAQEAVWVKLEWLNAAGEQVAKDYVTRFALRDGWARVEDVVPAPTEAIAVEVELGLQWAEGTIWWDDVQMVKAPPSPPRRVKVSTTCFLPPTPTTPEKNLAYYATKVDLAGREGADIVCLGETINYIHTGQKAHEVAEAIPGPSTRTLGDAARRNRLWIVASLYERKGTRVYNTAVLIDRQGNLAGRYRKTHLPETEMLGGVTPGSEYPVFKTDFGTIGLQVCYDNFFPEVARSLALQGAEILFTPIWGDAREDGSSWDIVARARAIDNAVHFVASTYTPTKRSLIIDAGGQILADTKGQEGLITAVLELDRRRLEPWLSVATAGEWKRLYPKERRPGTYGQLIRR
jgi:predicted amidohydrolase